MLRPATFFFAFGVVIMQPICYAVRISIEQEGNMSGFSDWLERTRPGRHAFARDFVDVLMGRPAPQPEQQTTIVTTATTTAAPVFPEERLAAPVARLIERGIDRLVPVRTPAVEEAHLDIWASETRTPLGGEPERQELSGSWAYRRPPARELDDDEPEPTRHLPPPSRGMGMGMGLGL